MIINLIYFAKVVDDILNITVLNRIDREKCMEFMQMKTSRKPALILIFTIGLTLASVFALPKLHTQYSLKQFLPLNNFLLKEEEQSRKTFYLSEIQPFVVTAELKKNTLAAESILELNPSAKIKSTWYEIKRIKSLEKLTQDLAQIQGVTGAVSLASVQGVLNQGDGLSIGPLIASLAPDLWSIEIPKNPLLVPTFVSMDGNLASIVVQINSTNTKDLKDLRQKIQEISSRALPFAEIQLGGSPAVQADINLLLESEVRNFIILGLLACFLTLGFVFSNASPLIIAFIVVLCANILVLATMALAGYSLSIMSSTIPILTTVDVMSLCLHTLLRYSEFKRNHTLLSHEIIVKKTIKAIFKPNMIASLTTTIGFLTLLLTDVPIIKDYGWTAAFSILIGWVTTSVLLYPLMLFLPPVAVRTWAWSRARWGLYLFRRSSLWMILIIGVAVVLGFKGQDLSWSARLFDDLPADNQVRLSTEMIDKKLGGIIPFDIELSGPPESWNDFKKIEKLTLLLKDLRIIPGVGSVLGLPDLIKSIKVSETETQLNSKSLAEIYFLYSLSNQSPLRNFLNADGAMTRIAVRTEDLPGNQIHDLARDFRTRASFYFPDMKVKIAGMGPTIHSLNNELSHELIFGFWQSMMFIGVILLFVFRSLRWALIACLPNLVPPAFLMGFLAFTETPIKPSVAIIFSISLGLAFNNTIYLLERLRTMQKKTASGKLLIAKTLWIEGNPCLISSLILLMGFSVFMASYFSMNRIFGFYMLLSMLAGLVGDLLLLPTLLNTFPWLLNELQLKRHSIISLARTYSLVILIVLIPALSNAKASKPKTQVIKSAPVDRIVQEMNQRFVTKDEQFIAQMKIIEADGAIKEREMQIWRMSFSKKEHFLKVRMLKPADLKGTSLLASIKNDQEDKWIYLPSTKQTRRLTGENNQGGLLGSEISAEDFEFNHDRTAESKLKGEIDIKGKKFHVVEVEVGQTSPNYSKIITYVSVVDFLPLKAECFDKKGQLLKVLQFSDYKKTTADKWRPSKIKVQNIQNQRGTEVILSQIKLNQNLKASSFSAKTLARD